jgi:hypothetical protein
MTENTNPESKKLSQQFGQIAVKGMVGAISIAATAGIPLVIQKILNPPSTPSTPSTPVASPATTPSPAAQTVQSAGTLVPVESVTDLSDEKPPGKGKGKAKKH